MPIVAVIVMTLVFWAIYWFVRMGGIQHMHARAAQRKDEARRARSRESDRTAQLRAVDDPREAAIVLMLLIPRGQDPTPQQVAAIEKKAVDTFEFHSDLLERMTQARFVASRAESFQQATTLFSNLFIKRLTTAERRDLVAMVEDVARLDGPTPAQIEAVTLLKQRLDVAAA